MSHRPSDKNRELVRNDPESEAAFDELRAIIAEELGVLAAMESPITDQESAEHAASFCADAILNKFAVRERPPGAPRYSWRDA